MKERLYFKPEINNKEKCKREKDRNKEKSNNTTLSIAITVCLCLAISASLFFALQGREYENGSYPENIKNDSLVCVSNDATPKKIASTSSDEKELKINAIFNGTDSLKKIYLTYTLKYSSEEDAYAAEAKAHAEFNKTLAASRYDVEKFDNKFSRYNNSLIISLTASGNELDDFSEPFFLIETDDNNSNVFSLENLKNNYEAQGFRCETTYNS